MINPPFDREKQKAKCFKILEEAFVPLRVRIRMLCATSKELDEALKHLQEAVEFAKKAIEIALDAKEE